MISPGCDIISVFFRCPVAEPIRENLIPDRFVYPCRCAIDICRVHPGYNKALLHTAIHPELFFCQETILKIIPDFLFRPQLEIIFASFVFRKKRCCPPDLIRQTFFIYHFLSFSDPPFFSAQNSGFIRISVMDKNLFYIISCLDIDNQSVLIQGITHLF